MTRNDESVRSGATKMASALLDGIRKDIAELAELIREEPAEIECDVLFAGVRDIVTALPPMASLAEGWISDLWPETPIALALDRLEQARIDLAATSGIITHIPAAH